MQTESSHISCLSSINQYCLLEICKHLDVMDVANLAGTCTRLKNFADAYIYPNKAKKIEIKDIKMKSIKTAFYNFGLFVTDLTFNLYMSGSMSVEKHETCLFVMEQCPNLATLRILGYDFRNTDTHSFQRVINNLQSLKELHLEKPPGLTNSWHTNLNSVHTLTLIEEEQMQIRFFDFFKNLSSLTIVFKFQNKWQTKDLLRKLCENGKIEELSISYGSFEEEAVNAPTLIFNKLKSLSIYYMENMSGFLKAMVKSQLPAIHFFELSEEEPTSMFHNDLLQFIGSKKTLEVVRLDFVNWDIPFLSPLIKILQKPSTPKRSILRLELILKKISAEDVSTINYDKIEILFYDNLFTLQMELVNANQHLIQLSRN